jgi:hypothetical protein
VQVARDMVRVDDGQPGGEQRGATP